MTAYDTDPADLALEREDARDEAIVQARKERMAGDYLVRGEYASLAAMQHAVNRTHEALERAARTYTMPPSVGQYLASEHERTRPVIDAALVLHAAVGTGLSLDDPEAHRLVRAILQRCDELTGLGLGIGRTA